MKRTITLLLLCITLQISAQCWQSVSAGYDHSLAINANEVKIDTSNLVSGTYFVKVTSNNNETKTVKIIKE